MNSSNQLSVPVTKGSLQTLDNAILQESFASKNSAASSQNMITDLDHGNSEIMTESINFDQFMQEIILCLDLKA